MGVLMADHYIGKTLNLLADLNIDSDTAVIVSSDHGENLGELNVYGDHQTADLPTTKIPMVIKWPGLSENVRFNAKHYHMDVFATILDLLERKIPESWDAKSFASSWRAGQDDGREALVLSQAAWACQRSVRFEDYIYIKTIHDAFHLWEEEMLFDVNEDPHQTKNLAGTSLIPLQKGRDTLANWHAEMMNSPARGRDPHDNVMKEGGPYHVRGKLESYINRLKETERSLLAERLAERYP
jgi:choline-sulfatase